MLDQIVDPLSRIKDLYQKPKDPLGNQMGDPNETAIDPMSAMTRGLGSHDNTDTPPEVQHVMQDKLMELINHMPERNKPGLVRKIFAGVSALSRDPNSVEGVLYAPYHRQMQDFSTKFDMLDKAANLERLNNAASYDRFNKDRKFQDTLDDNDRLRTSMFLKNSVANRTNDIRQENSDRNYEIQQKKLEIQRELLAGGNIYRTKDGKLYLNRKNGNVDELDINDLSEQELNDIKTQGRLKEIEAQGNIREAIAKMNNAQSDTNNRRNNEQSDINNQRNNDTREKVAGNKTNKATTTGMNETQKKQWKINRANEYKRANPNSASWITIDDKGNVGITKPGAFNKMTSEEYNRIQKYIDPDYDGPTGALPGDNTKKPETQTPNQPKTPAVIPPRGKLHIKEKTTGKEYWLPIEQWPQAEKTGKYEKVVGK